MDQFLNVWKDNDELVSSSEYCEIHPDLARAIPIPWKNSLPQLFVSNSPSRFRMVTEFFHVRDIVTVLFNSFSVEI